MKLVLLLSNYETQALRFIFHIPQQTQQEREQLRLKDTSRLQGLGHDSVLPGI